MVSTFSTGKLHLEKPAPGDFVDSWGPVINAVFDNTDTGISGTAAVTITSADITLTTSQARNLHINCSGALSATRQLIWPNTAGGLSGGVWIVTNGCTGGFTLTAIVNGGTGVVIPQGKRMVVFSDGTNMFGGDDWIANAIASRTSNPNGALAGNAGSTERPITDFIWDRTSGFLYFATGGTGWKQVAPNFPLATADITDAAITFPKLAADVAADAKAFAAQRYQINDERSSGTDGDALSFTTFNTRTLNTEKIDDLGITPSANQLPLTAGTYYVEAEATAYFSGTITRGTSQVAVAKLRLRNVTDSVTLANGLSLRFAIVDDGGGNNELADFSLLTTVAGWFTLAGTKNIELQQFTDCSFAGGSIKGGKAISSGEVEVYSSLRLWKVA